MKKIITNSSQNYAQALFETGHDFEKDLETVQQVLSCCADFKNVISNPAVDLKTKYEILDEIFKENVNANVLQFIKILTEKNRLNEFEQIKSSYIEKVNEHNNIKKVEIISAIELNDETKTKIINKLSEKLNKTIVPTWETNKEIISGLVFKIGDDIIDTSLLNKVESIGKNIR